MTYLNFNDDCPDSLELELQFLHNNLSRVLKENPQHHLFVCPICQKYLNELDGIYESISAELSNPVSNKTLDFACCISTLQPQKGQFICKPVIKKTSEVAVEYQLVLLFSKKENQNFCDYDFKNNHDSNMYVRVVSDPAWNKLLLFFKHKDQINYANYSFTIPRIIEKSDISANGTAVIPFTQIKNLNNKSIFFYKKNKKTKKPNLLRKFQESLIIL